VQRYFFDLSAGGWQCQDDIGLILCSQDEIRGEATRTAIEFARAGLPGADLSDLELDVVVLPPQEDEFTCMNCFLVKHRSQIAEESGNGFICVECAA